MRKLYIFTLNWNGVNHLKNLYPTLNDSLKNIDFEWLIKDNNSSDNSIQYLKELNDKRLNIISYKNNLQNFSAGNNYLFNEASPKEDDLIMLLNNDVIFNDTKSINNMLNIIDNDSNVGVVGARLLYSQTNNLQHAGVVFNIQNKCPTHFRCGEESNINDTKNREFQVVTGAALITKAEYFKNVFTNNKSGVSGMDENYQWAFDDVDLCLAIKYNMEKKIIYCGHTNIFHEESPSLKKNQTNKLF